jgi:26S proteasome regulatory subunit N13
MAQSMFSRGPEQPGMAAPKSHLVEYKAGRMTVDGSTVTADKRKGLIVIKKSDDLVNFIWKDRVTDVEEEPIVLFTDEVVFHKCKSCKDGRVYYLKFSNGRRDFYWMQEPDETKDDAFCRQVNHIINGTSEAAPIDAAAAASTDVMSIAQLLSETPAPRMHGGLVTVPGATSVAATPAVSATPAVPPAVDRPGGPARLYTAAAAAAAGAVAGTPAPTPVAGAARSGGGATLDDNVMRGIMAGLAAQMPAVRQGQADGVDLADILKPENIEPLLSESDVVERLCPFLPEGNNLTKQDVLENVRSPQFAQALRSFSHALSTGQLDEVMVQFGVDAAAARAAGGGITGLCKAILEAHKAKQDGSDRMDES